MELVVSIFFFTRMIMKMSLLYFSIQMTLLRKVGSIINKKKGALY
jgi:hypothetical protein